MAIQNIPVWSFPPNWSSPPKQTLEWLTRVLSSPSGAEQRASLRLNPRREFETDFTVETSARAALNLFVSRHGGRNFYLPMWHEAYRLSAAATVGSNTIECHSADDGGLKAGDIVFISDPTDHRRYELAEVNAISGNVIELKAALAGSWAPHSPVHPVRIARFAEQPSFLRITDTVQHGTVRFKIMEKNEDERAVLERRVNGPMIYDGLITNSYHVETGRGGYFHHNSGTSEGQFAFIYGAFLAYEALIAGNPTNEARSAADYYLNLAQEMLDAMGDGSTVGPMLRQPIPDDPDTITLMHWLFAARGDVPEQGIVLDYQVTRNGNTLTIPSNAAGGRVQHVWQIYPASSELLYASPYSPAFDINSPSGETQLSISTWQRIGDTTVITIPSGADPGISEWKISYGFYEYSSIATGDGYEAFPSWTRIPGGYAACAPDTFRWFEQATAKAVALDTRAGKAQTWEKLRLAMRRSCVRGQAITDLREVIRPLPGFDVIPASGEPDGMFCYSDHPRAFPPIGPGLDNGWIGYDFWSRATNGDIIGNIPDSGNVVAQVQLGRGFADQWREQTNYQTADQYLYVAISASKKPNLALKEFFLIFVSSTMEYDENARWYADLGSKSTFVATTGDVIEFFIPRSEFKLRSFAEGTGDTVWGTSLPNGQTIQNFGVSSEMAGAYQIRLRAMRLVAGNTPDDIKGAKMPFFPGALPFAINADTIRQQFIGWNGSPFHGYQMADHWWWLGNDADEVHPALSVSDLPIPSRTNGSLTFPISGTTSVGNVSKPKNALLMEQQLIFLQHAQEQWHSDGGTLGPFAHTFVLNTPARSSLGWPTPHTWVYINDDPNTRWVGYQVRLVESLAKLIELAHSDPAFSDAVSLANTMVSNWLSWLNGYWPNLNGKAVGGTVIYGMPTDFDDPAKGQPETLYEEPHAAAVVMRACLQLEKAGFGSSLVNQSLMLRCWQYLELVWRTNGEMAFTWSPDPSAKQWYGFWHGEIITSLAELLLSPSHVSSGIDLNTVRTRLVQTTGFLREYGVSYNNAGTGLETLRTYRGFNVLLNEPDRGDDSQIGFDRNLDELDNRIAFPVFHDQAGFAFETFPYSWTLEGRDEYISFINLLFILRGRFTSVWLPTFSADLALTQDTAPGDRILTVENIGFTAGGGPEIGQEYVCIFLKDGSSLFRKITASTLSGLQTEIIELDEAFYDGLRASDVKRISFMQLCRLDQDRIEINHDTDTKGYATCKATFRGAPNIRKSNSGF